MVPGDSGSGSYRLTNAGSLAGELSIAFPKVINTPGTGGEYADGNGDLGASAEIAAYFDADAGCWRKWKVALIASRVKGERL